MAEHVKPWPVAAPYFDPSSWDSSLEISPSSVSHECLTVADPHLFVIDGEVTVFFEALFPDRKVIAYAQPTREAGRVGVALDASRCGLKLSFPFVFRLASGEIAMIPQQSGSEGQARYPCIWVSLGTRPDSWTLIGPLWTSGFRHPVSDVVIWYCSYEHRYWVILGSGTSLRSAVYLAYLEEIGGHLQVVRQISATYGRGNARAHLYRIARALDARWSTPPSRFFSSVLLKGLKLKPDRPAGLCFHADGRSVTPMLQGRGLWSSDRDIRQSYGRGVFALSRRDKFGLPPDDISPIYLPSRIPGSWNELKTHTLSMAYAQGKYFGAVDGYAADGKWRILFGQGRLPIGKAKNQ